MFVSAVNPEPWQSCLSTRKCTDKQQKSQLSRLKNHSIYCNELSIYIDIHHNEDSRLKFYPTAQDEKADRRLAHQMLVQHRRVATTTGERRSIVNTASTLGRSEAKLLWIGQLLLFLLAHSALLPRLAPVMARSTALLKPVCAHDSIGLVTESDE